jgi:hypothetical protein
LDEEAGSWLTRREYYAEVERTQTLLAARRWREWGMGAQ